jgi:hypothetical protein
MMFPKNIRHYQFPECADCTQKKQIYEKVNILDRLTLVAGLFLAVVLHLWFLYSFLMKRCLLATLLSSFVTLVTAAAGPLPNAVMIMADDLGWSDIAAYRVRQGLETQGHTPIPTPNIDRLAANGMMFMNAHSAASVCAPSRFAMMTGSNPFRNGRQWGTWNLNETPNAFNANRNHVTVGEVAQDGGYRTAFLMNSKCVGTHYNSVDCTKSVHLFLATKS